MPCRFVNLQQSFYWGQIPIISLHAHKRTPCCLAMIHTRSKQCDLRTFTQHGGGGAVDGVDLGLGEAHGVNF